MMRRLPMLLVFGLTACGEATDDTGVDTDVDDRAWYLGRLPEGFPQPRVPDDNPMSEDKAELGRHLFYDTRLSGNGTQSCGTCHLQDLAFTDGLAVSVGSTGESTPRGSMSLANIGYATSLTWGNPALTSLEAQMQVPFFGEFPVELGLAGKEDEALARLNADPLYEPLRTAAFPDAAALDMATVTDAIATFLRTLITGDSPFDRFTYQGDDTALSESALRGMELFYGENAECHHCHGGFNFTQSTAHSRSSILEVPFHNNGLYNIDGMGGYPLPNTGVHEITGDPTDMGRFKAPSLRNIAVTAPYMHDGSLATLDDVLDMYEAGGHVIEEGPNAGDGRLNPYKSGFVSGFEGGEEAKADLKAFLESLTDEGFLTNPAFADPFAD